MREAFIFQVSIFGSNKWGRIHKIIPIIRTTVSFCRLFNIFKLQLQACFHFSHILWIYLILL